MPLINFNAEAIALPATQKYLYFLAVALIPEDFEELDGLRPIEWRYLALEERGTGRPVLVAFSETQIMMQFTAIGRGFNELPPSTDIIRAEVGLLRRGPCPYTIWLDPVADAFHAALRSGAYRMLDEGLEALL